MSRLQEQLRRLLLDIYLWGQRHRFPFPPAVRSLANVALGSTIGRTIPERTDEWPHPLNPVVRGDDPVYFPSSGPASVSPNTLASTRNPLWPNVNPQLRCAVTTASLDLGGLQNVAAFIARRLPSYGLDTTVVQAAFEDSNCSGPSAPLAESLRLNGVPVVKLSRRDGQEWLKTHRPDVISMHWPPDWLVAAAVEIRIPTIETLHDASLFFDRDVWQREQLRSQQITGFVAVSELVRRQYLRANHVYPPDRIVTIPNGVDTEHINSRDRIQARSWLGLRNEFLFISLARYSPQKNAFGLVTAFSEVAHAYPKAHLLFAGPIVDPPYFEQVRRLRDGLTCASQIHLRGPCPDVPAVLAAADAFVLDSFYEGWSLASMEALSAGLPVVLSEVGGAREQVGENGKRGFVIGNPLGDPEAVDWPSIGRARFSDQVNRAALVKAMRAIVADSDRWRDARAELKAESISRFSVEVCVRRHADLLTRAAASEPPFRPI
jgi:glycosyltransferase involved in cell wall biosynthesis